MRNLFKLKKENEKIKDTIIRNTKKLFEHEEEYCKPVSRGNFWNSNYIEYEMMIEIKTYQSDNIFGKLKPSWKILYYKCSLKIWKKWKIQLTIAINLISSKDINEERVMHSKSDYGFW